MKPVAGSLREKNTHNLALFKFKEKRVTMETKHKYWGHLRYMKVEPRLLINEKKNTDLGYL